MQDREWLRGQIKKLERDANLTMVLGLAAPAGIIWLSGVEFSPAESVILFCAIFGPLVAFWETRQARIDFLRSELRGLLRQAEGFAP